MKRALLIAALLALTSSAIAQQSVTIHLAPPVGSITVRTPNASATNQNCAAALTVSTAATKNPDGSINVQATASRSATITISGGGALLTLCPVATTCMAQWANAQLVSGTNSVMASASDQQCSVNLLNYIDVN